MQTSMQNNKHNNFKYDVADIDVSNNESMEDLSKKIRRWSK